MENKIKFKIKRATVDDLSTVQALTKKLFTFEIEGGFDDNLDPEWALSEEGKNEIFQRITSSDSCGFVVRADNRVVGYLIGLIQEEETGRNEPRYSELEHMFVKKDCRGTGIGEQLVAEFKSWTKEQGLKLMKVNVSYKNEKAIEFYKKVGLNPVDVAMTTKI